MTLTLLTGANGEKPGETGRVIPNFLQLQAQNQALIARATGLPDASARFTTTTNDTGQVIDLTDLLFTFSANQVYKVKIKAFAGSSTNTSRIYQEIEQLVLGGTTPVLFGEPRIKYAAGIISAASVSWGRVALHATTSTGTVTVTAAETSAGISLGNFTNAVGALTFPTSRLARVVAAHWSEDAGTIGDARFVQVRAINATAGTATVGLGTQNGTEALEAAGAQPAGTNNIDIYMDLAPPIQIFLAMNSNNVEVQVLGVTSQTWNHQVDVFIDDAKVVPVT